MATTIRVDLSDLHLLQKEMVGALTDKAALTKVAVELAATSLKQTDTRFDERVQPSGRPWRPRKDNKPHPILERSGALRRGIAADADAGGVKLHTTTGRGDEERHQWGGDGHRQFLGWGGSDLAELGGLAEDRLASFVGGSFAGETL